MSDSTELLKRQAEWQKRRAHLTWPEKIRLAEAMLPTLRRWNSSGTRSQSEIKRSPSRIPAK